jgi:hypothetical protein
MILCNYLIFWGLMCMQLINYIDFNSTANVLNKNQFYEKPDSNCKGYIIWIRMVNLD